MEGVIVTVSTGMLDIYVRGSTRSRVETADVYGARPIPKSTGLSQVEL